MDHSLNEEVIEDAAVNSTVIPARGFASFAPTKTSPLIIKTQVCCNGSSPKAARFARAGRQAHALLTSANWRAQSNALATLRFSLLQVNHFNKSGIEYG
jgi:hypothetical protein